MKATVMLPTRMRFEMTKQSIATLGDGDYEILIRIDEDEPQMNEYLYLGLMNEKVTVIVGERFRYLNLHLYYNEMCKIAKGDWLLLWNDDAIMQTPNWLDQITLDPQLPYVLNFYDNINLNLFPAISRKLYEIMGSFSMSAHNDSWVQAVGWDAKCMRYVPGINVHHLREEIFDFTKADTQSTYAITSPLFDRPHMLRLRAAYVNKVKAWIKENTDTNSVP